MTIEEFLNKHGEVIKISVSDIQGEEDMINIIRMAWNAGYDFRLQEEELNKGASF